MTLAQIYLKLASSQYSCCSCMSYVESFLGSPDDVNEGAVSDEYIAARIGEGSKRALTDVTTAEVENTRWRNAARRDNVILGLALCSGK